MFLDRVPLQFYVSYFNYIPLTCLFVFVFLWNQNRSIFPGKLPFVIKTRQDCRPQSPFWTPFGSLFIFSLPTPDPVQRSRVPSPSLVCDEKTVCTVGYASVIMISWSFQKQNTLRTHLSTRILNFGESLDIADSRRSLNRFCVHWNI